MFSNFPFQQMSPELILEVCPFLFPDMYLTGSRYLQCACHKISLFFNACQETSKQYWIVMDLSVGHAQGTISSRCWRHSDPVIHAGMHARLPSLNSASTLDICHILSVPDYYPASVERWLTQITQCCGRSVLNGFPMWYTEYTSAPMCVAFRHGFWIWASEISSGLAKAI